MSLSFTSELAPFLGPVLVGTAFSSFFYGIMVLQCYVYHLNYQNDRPMIKLVVAFLLFADAVETVLSLVATYNVFVTGFGNILAINLISFSETATMLSTAVIVVVVQLFYAWRVFVLTKKVWMPCLIVLGAAACLISAIGMAIAMTEVKWLSNIVNLRSIILAGTVSAVITDSFITISLVYYFVHSRTGFPATDGILARLVRMTVQTGIATTTIVIAILVTYLVSSSAYFGITLIVSKVYTNTLMSTLNMRSGWGTGDLTRSQAISWDNTSPDSHSHTHTASHHTDPPQITMSFHAGSLLQPQPLTERLWGVRLLRSSMQQLSSQQAASRDSDDKTVQDTEEEVFDIKPEF